MGDAAGMPERGRQRDARPQGVAHQRRPVMPLRIEHREQVRDEALLRVGSLLVGSSGASVTAQVHADRSEEHTSELQSRGHLVCRLLLEKKNKISAETTR